MSEEKECDRNEPVATRASVSSEAPWLGLSPYTRAEAKFFFGRNAEVEELFERTREQPLTVVYGQSGLGKTSLLKAGLLPRLEDEGIPGEVIRFRYDADSATLLRQTVSALEKALRSDCGEEAPPDNPDCEGVTLWEWFHLEANAASLQGQLPVLVFDQFEEIFTLGETSEGRREERENWLSQMADLLQNRPPVGLTKRLRSDRRLARRYDFGAEGPRIIFVLREDYLSRLEEWKLRIPLVMQNRMALQPLSGLRALEAIVRPAQLSEPPLVSEAVGERIVRASAGVTDEVALADCVVSPPILSLIAKQLNQERLDKGVEQIEEAMVTTGADDILKTFYEESFAGFQARDAKVIRALIEDELITEIGGYRTSVAEGDAVLKLRKSGVNGPKGALEFLRRERRLLSVESRRIPRLEVTHDVMVPIMVESRQGRRRRIEREEAQRRIMKAGVVVAVLSVAAASGWAVGFAEKEKLREANESLEAEKKKVETLMKGLQEKQQMEKRNWQKVLDRHEEEISKNLKSNIGSFPRRSPGLHGLGLSDLEDLKGRASGCELDEAED